MGSAARTMTSVAVPFYYNLVSEPEADRFNRVGQRFGHEMFKSPVRSQLSAAR